MLVRHFKISLLAFLFFSTGLLAFPALGASSEETVSDPALAQGTASDFERARRPTAG